MQQKFMQEIRRAAERRRPCFANENWRPFPAKHTRVKVIGGNGRYSLAMKIERPGRPDYGKADPHANNQFAMFPYARFGTFYDAMVGAKAFLDWLMEPYSGAEFFTADGKPCHSIGNAKFAVISGHRGNWRVYDLDEQHIIAREDTRERAIRSMMEFGTDTGTVVRCI
jgi:hypothetical protein